ncbi:Aldose 1-epimerase [Ascidiaceihabitans donghaensis]|uniref:Aldose 1-epimerase n=1 Tax=Ascidiaceihabitans donghaensis TaxID=1510460 RepID=A0A2R8BER4_9RHOB|nr:aldose epimerase family protein [Ascidiaceihabitans donghaensis]SPH21561.1 Aldose 1-epimerase [Ascidiaceihabitans donghaensis]
MTDKFTLSCGPLHAEVLAQGATLSRLRYVKRDLLLGFEDSANHANIPIFAGPLVGPIANRLANGQLVIDGKTYQMQCNENNRTTLHSGDSGLHAIHWTASDVTPTQITLKCVLEDGVGGLPGLRKFTATYRLTANALSLDITATTTQKTPMNIAHHPYWALDKTISDTKLWVAGDRYVEVDNANIPTGQTPKTEGTVLDFNTLRYLPRAKNIDHCVCLPGSKHMTPRHIVTLQASDGLCVDIDSTEAGLQVYDGAGLPQNATCASFPHALAPYAGVALEPQGWPDAPNHASFPDILLAPGDTYRQTTRYRISKR